MALDLSLLTIKPTIAFLLVLCRLAGMLASAPLLNMRSVPAQVKVGLAVTTALILFPLHGAQVSIPKDLIQFSLMVIQESIIGLLIGFTANLVFMGLQVAGEYISMQMGLSAANVLDPVTQTQSAIIGQFFFYLGGLLFLSLNIHHGLIIGIDRSFQWIPLGHFFGEGNLTIGLLTERFIRLSADMLVLALLVGLPLMGVLLVAEMAVAFVSKVMPQMNAYMVAIPLKVALGLVLIVACMPYLSMTLGDQYAHLMQVLMNLYKPRVGI
jgi:flagellar biosynthetic protein FliR